jgi:hypothetical protein
MTQLAPQRVLENPILQHYQLPCAPLIRNRAHSVGLPSRQNATQILLFGAGYYLEQRRMLVA